MPCLGISRPIGPQILPENCISLDRLERDAFPRPSGPRRFFSRRCVLGPISHLQRLFISMTLQKPTPPPIDRHAQAREIRAPTGTVIIQINHERAGAVAAARDGARPVVVVPVVAGGVVALGPHTLDVQVWMPPLEGARAVLDTPDGVVTVEQGTLGEPRGGVDALGDAVVDYAGGVFSYAFR